MSAHRLKFAEVHTFGASSNKIIISTLTAGLPMQDAIEEPLPRDVHWDEVVFTSMVPLALLEAFTSWAVFVYINNKVYMMRSPQRPDIAKENRRKMNLVAEHFKAKVGDLQSDSDIARELLRDLDERLALKESLDSLP